MKRLCSLALLALLAAAPAALAQPAVERVEPAFWWAGMHHPDLQVLVYGDDVGRARATLAPYPGVRLDRTVAVESPNYLFLEMTVTDEARPGTLAITLEHPDGDQTLDYELRQRTRTPGSYAQGFSSRDVIYLMMPDRFANADPGNDEVAGMLEGVDRQNPNARQGGDFAGVLQNLDYIDGLGMTAIWFTPVFENDMTPEYGAYHGYAATDMYRVDRRFGSNDEFLALVDAVHGRGMKVIMDMIHNHVGDRHWWMADPPASDWVHSWERYGQTNYTGAATVDPYASEHDYEKLVNGWFVAEMPDLDQDNDLLVQYLLQNTVWWIEHAGIDGIRMDTYLYPDKAYMARWARYVLDAYPDFNIVGESWVENVPHEAYWQRGFRAHPEPYESHLPSVTDFPLAFAAEAAFSGAGPARLYSTLSQDHVYPEPNLLVTFLDNHDLPRFFSRVGEDEGAFQMGLAFLLTTRGIPQVYYGTELAMPDGDRAAGGDGYKRTPMMGGWPGDERSVFTAAGRTDRENRAFEFMRALATWRQTADVVHHGRLTQFIPQDDVYVYFRWDEDDTVMVALNAAAEPRALDLSRYQERILGHTTGRNVVTGETVRLDGETLAVPARTPLVLELMP
jgi:glycosidase